MTTIYFVRHGQSVDNVAGVTSGAERDAELTPEGRQQAETAGKQLVSKSIDLIVCSPMKRAVETAQIIAGQIGYNTEHIVQRREFIERFMGVYSGVEHHEYRQANASGDVHESLETTESMLHRVTQGLDWLKDHQAQNIVVVAHGGTGRAVKAYHQKFHHSEMYEVDGFANTEIYEFVL
jgi:broad specificity phosphatase PhoE